MFLKLGLCLGVLAQIILAQENPAIIIGGYTSGEDAPQVTDTIELFGCPFSGGDALPIPNYPIGTYLTGAYYIHDGTQHLLASCGGYQCNSGNCVGLSDQCWTFDLDTKTWVEHSTMTRGRYSHLLTMMKNWNSTSDDTYYPVVAGYHQEAEIYNLGGSGEWENLVKMEQRFFSLDCIVYNNEDGFFYMMVNDVRQINPATGEVKIVLGTVPEELRRPGKCALVKRNNRMGIFTRYGFWFDITNRKFEVVHEPPFLPWAEEVNAMWTFRGRPTIFGNPICDVDGSCSFVRVIQYVPETDDWIELGRMANSRRFHEVVEVSYEWCEAFEPDDYVPVTTQSPVPTPIPADRNKAALIVGGFADTLHTPGVTDVVELFGCDPDSKESEAIEPYPKGVYLNGGTFVDNAEGGYAVFCGGYQCSDGNNCGLESVCHKYPREPGTFEWGVHSFMQRARYAHEIHMMPEANSSSPDLYPVAIGYHLNAEIFQEPQNNQELGTWMDYVHMEERFYSLDCIAYDDEDHKVYTIVNEIKEFDMDTGLVNVIDRVVPQLVTRPGKCLIVEIDGEKGIFTRYGFWYNIQERKWYTKHEPPFHPWSFSPNAMYMFQGRPTIFGNPICDNDANCEHRRIVQYDPDTDQWYNLGEMIHGRRFHTVIEVSKDVCEVVPTVPPTTTTTTTTTIRTTTTTTTTTTRSTTKSTNPPSTNSPATNPPSTASPAPATTSGAGKIVSSAFFLFAIILRFF